MPRKKKDLVIVAAGVTLAAVIFASEYRHREAGHATSGKAVELGYVGRVACAGCHQEEDDRWRGSHHDLAMQEATPETVRGDFSGVSLGNGGVTSSFFERGGRFFVRTDGPDGALHDYEVAYTYGVEPLQQYLVELPGGRFQALPFAWDARPAADGGRRWYHLYAGDAPRAGDSLHWTGIDQSWNYMCAECHSTAVEKHYRGPDLGYETSFAEVDVACEACHGPGSRHVAWAETPTTERDAGDHGLAVDLGDPGRFTWVPDPIAPRRLAPSSETAELEVCARCHSRRMPIAEVELPGRPLLDSHRLELLADPELYQADGQIRGEVYVYGSFLQSAMHGAGVTCSDCHDPHGLEPRLAGTDLCVRCHAGGGFDTPEHHFHEAGGPGSACADCHMPATTYMGVDPRRDHSLRVPRPDLTAKVGTPNACNGCHRERSPEWAAASIAERTSRPERWAARLAEPHYGEILHAGRRGEPGSGAALAALADRAEAPAIVRATALELLGRRPDPAAPGAVARAVGDADPLVRLGAALAAAALEPGTRAVLLAPLLDDPRLAVRVEAARVLAPVPVGELGTARAAFERALGEYGAVQVLNADRPEALANLGWLEIRDGRLDHAAGAFGGALDLDPGYELAWRGLAEIERRRGAPPSRKP